MSYTYQVDIPAHGWTDANSRGDMIAILIEHIPGFGKKLAPQIVDKIYSVGPTSADIEDALANVDEGKRKAKLRQVLRVVHRQPPPPALAPALHAPYGAVRGGGSPQPRVGPYRQPPMNPNWKTIACSYYERGFCRYARSSCTYAHGANDTRANYCWFFLEGNAESCPGKSTGRCTLWHGTM